MTVILWKQLTGLGGIFAIYELLPGFLLSAFAILVVNSAFAAALLLPRARPCEWCFPAGQGGGTVFHRPW